MKKTKTEKGITLIALIITIIVLLILAVVAIRAVQGDGILRHAENARGEYTDAQAEEKVKLAAYEYQIAKNEGKFSGSLDKYLVEKVFNAKLGAIVNYEEPESLGYDGEWVIIGVDNGKIVLASTKTVDTLELAGRDGWNNGITKLNNMCSQYADGKIGVYGRSIKASDLNKLLDYNPAKQLDGKPYGFGTVQEYGVKVTYKKVGENTFEMTRVKADGTSETTTETFEAENGRTGEILDINSDTVLGFNESITIDSTNSYYQYAVSIAPTSDGLGDNNYYVYSINNTAAGNPDRLGYKEIFLPTDTKSYWLAEKSDLAHNSGAGWGMMYVSISSGWGMTGKFTLYHSSKVGETNLGAGEFSATYGVRPVVYLDSDLYLKRKSDGTYDITTEKVEDEYVDENTEMVDIYGNKFTVPTGFKILADDTTGYTKETLDVTKGIVIQDDIGNEFVWVPVGKVYTDTEKTEANTKNITLDRYTFSASGIATKYTANEYIETDNVNNFKKSVLGEEGKGNGYGGYYIGRYEARTNSNGYLTTNPNDNIWHHINGVDSVPLANSMYATNSSFATELINSYAWDTAIVFIQTFESDRTVPYSRQVSLNNKDNVGIALQGTNKLSSEYLDKARNIYDMAANCAEWTTETKDGNYVFRGADFDYNGTTTTKYCSKRGSGNYRYIQFSFRPVLYLK